MGCGLGSPLSWIGLDWVGLDQKCSCLWWIEFVWLIFLHNPTHGKHGNFWPNRAQLMGWPLSCPCLRYKLSNRRKRQLDRCCHVLISPVHRRDGSPSGTSSDIRLEIVCTPARLQPRHKSINAFLKSFEEACDAGMSDLQLRRIAFSAINTRYYTTTMELGEKRQITTATTI